MSNSPASASPQDQLRHAFGLLQQGRVDQARVAAQKLREIAPNHPDVLHLLGLADLQQGRARDAEKFIRLAIAQAPRQAFFHANLGNALRQQGRAEDARAAYSKAIEVGPDFPGGYLNRGTLNEDEGKFEAAQADFEKLIALNPKDPQGYARLAQLHALQGGFEAARRVSEDGLKAQPGHPMFVVSLATALERLGDLDGAIETAETLLSKNPQAIGAARVWASAKRQQGALEEARDRLERFNPAQLPPPAQRILHAELGQIYDQLGDAEEAFDHFARQNAATETIMKQTGLDKATYMDQVAALRAYSDAAPVSEPYAVPAGDPKPVFLVGFPRSGTTLLDQILDAHTDIQVLEEKPVLLPLRDRIAASQKGYPAGLDDLGDTEIAELRALYWQTLKDAGADVDGRIVVNKLPLNIIHAPLIHRVFPDAHFILALRHPADSVLSCFMQDFQLNASMAHFLTLDDSVALYDAVMGLWRRAADRFGLSVSEVRYEGLVQDLRGETEPVISALGLSWQEAQNDPQAHALSRGTIRTPSYAQVSQPIYDRAAARWRRYETQLAEILPRLRDHIHHFGYDD